MAYTGVRVDGLADMVTKLGALERDLRRNASGELRQGAKDISLDVVARRHQLLGGSGTPQEWGIVEKARVKYDRFVAVQVPGVKPALSGVKRIPAARARSLAIAVEYGSTDPRLGGPPRGALVGRNIGRISDHVRGDYQQLVLRVLRKYGLL